MSNYPEETDVFVNKTGADFIASSDPNNAFDGVEAIEGFVGALGKDQSWSTTLMTLLRQYKSGMVVSVAAGDMIVSAGEATLENTSSTKYVLRRNTEDVDITADSLDVGSLIATRYTVYLTGGTAATTAPVVFSTDSIAPSGIGTAPYRKIGWFQNEAVGSFAVTYAGGFEGGRVVQLVNTQSGAVATGVTVMVDDDTLPQIDEGDEFMTLDIVPSSPTSKLKIEVVAMLSKDGAGVQIIGALFQDTTADAIAVGRIDQTAGFVTPMVFTHFMTADTVKKTTFSFRAGGTGNTTTLNGGAGSRMFGGGMASSITITEYEVG